ncbi:EcoAI/FtnUII family type I restriction enzme subunit R [Vibrio crassostreae]|uniref:EcoAI/FtnUII family type I restriction enzme subunit R n=1 Tax=Vibrio crassostreae TaxID=246167 RepID=UPI001045E11F|nr:DEAD/DEAH box helicase family protein [Vibrio crassostreae]TCN86247.1 type I restriction enzyme R subunit [Vibrio crassostreae]TCV11125.1 type I restriction enzyme R subunit [Vibrio crassostreae]TWD64213.1 type I restriction enzyme R subunit [Vibrio crassostreae]
MDSKAKKELSEQDICDLFITPAIKNAGWDQLKQVRREFPLTPGPIGVRGDLSFRRTNKRKFADYALFWEPGVPVGIVEAKNNKYTVSHGMQQALGYADIVEVPSAFSSNGDAFASHNKVAEPSEDVEVEFPLDQFPPPELLWLRYKKHHNIEDEMEDVVLQPYHVDSSGKEPRYYQVEAINRTVEAAAKGQPKILLVMATGTGKTYTAFQIIYRLRKAGKAKKVLFLADRNILVDQTLMNDFKPFGSSMCKIKNRKIDPSYEVYLGLYQALTGPDESDKIFKTVSPDFFDLIVIDECHRGSAKEDSNWREILQYFDSATQIGLTATPKEIKPVDGQIINPEYNIKYFGEPVYKYSLKQGIDDGFLAPYKVIKIDIDRDIDGWTPPPGMSDDLGSEIEQRTYNQQDFDKILVLNQRTKLIAKRVMKYLRAYNPYAKTIIFCEDIEHAERMRKAITNEAREFIREDSRYVMRITGDSVEGKAELDNFIDSESRYPVIATTSELLSTGVDAKTCKLIVLDKNILSTSMFKQIIGRGTRIDEEYNKYYFTIMDFKGATKKFYDADFDGEPVIIYEPTDDDDPLPPDPEPEEGDDDYIEDDDESKEPRLKAYASSVSARIISERLLVREEGGELITESYRDYSKRTITEDYSSLDDFLSSWNSAKKKKAIIDELEKKGILIEQLAEEVGREFGDFDLICHIAYDQPPLTRKERAENVKKRNYFAKYSEQAKEVLNALLDKYQDEGVAAIETGKVLRLKPFDKIGTPMEIVNDVFGGKQHYDNAINELEQQLFIQEQA